ncbi:MAG: HmuY family protein, partial [Bergeyella zoohelcum]|nr:HmuY family protein [Bergeyella zoohelcum]
REHKEIPKNEANTTNWDIAFFNERIHINGGKIRHGKGAAAILNSSFEEISQAPDESLFRQDESERVYDLAIPLGDKKGWYYTQNAIIYPIKNRTIIIKTADEKQFIKLRIKSYYKDSPNPPNETSKAGYYTFEYSQIQAPKTNENETKVENLFARNEEILYNLRENKIISLSEKNTENWDIGFKYNNIFINSSKGGFAILSKNFNDVKSIEKGTDFSTEKTLPKWYTYDMNTHIVTPINQTIIIKTGDGKKYIKLRIDSFYKDKNQTNINEHSYYHFTFMPIDIK